MNKHFIKTQDEQMAKKLSMLGFKLISSDGGVYTFFNKAPISINFSEDDLQKIVYTNILCM